MTNDNDPPLPACVTISMSAIADVPRATYGTQITKEMVIASLQARLKRDGTDAFLNYIVDTWEFDGVEYGTPVT